MKSQAVSNLPARAIARKKMQIHLPEPTEVTRPEESGWQGPVRGFAR